MVLQALVNVNDSSTAGRVWLAVKECQRPLIQIQVSNRIWCWAGISTWEVSREEKGANSVSIVPLTRRYPASGLGSVVVTLAKGIRQGSMMKARYALSLLSQARRSCGKPALFSSCPGPRLFHSSTVGHTLHGESLGKISPACKALSLYFDWYTLTTQCSNVSLYSGTVAAS